MANPSGRGWKSPQQVVMCTVPRAVDHRRCQGSARFSAHGYVFTGVVPRQVEAWIRLTQGPSAQREQGGEILLDTGLWNKKSWVRGGGTGGQRPDRYPADEPEKASTGFLYGLCSALCFGGYAAPTHSLVYCHTQIRLGIPTAAIQLPKTQCLKYSGYQTKTVRKEKDRCVASHG